MDSSGTSSAPIVNFPPLAQLPFPSLPKPRPPLKIKYWTEIKKKKHTILPVPNYKPARLRFFLEDVVREAASLNLVLVTIFNTEDATCQPGWYRGFPVRDT